MWWLLRRNSRIYIAGFLLAATFSWLMILIISKKDVLPRYSSCENATAKGGHKQLICKHLRNSLIIEISDGHSLLINRNTKVKDFSLIWSLYIGSIGVNRLSTTSLFLSKKWWSSSGWLWDSYDSNVLQICHAPILLSLFGRHLIIGGAALHTQLSINKHSEGEITVDILTIRSSSIFNNIPFFNGRFSY